MNLDEKSFTELQALFDITFQKWHENILQIERVRKKECVKYADFVRSRTDFRQLARENLKLHNSLVRLDLELQIRIWTGLND